MLQALCQLFRPWQTERSNVHVIHGVDLHGALVREQRSFSWGTSTSKARYLISLACSGKEFRLLHWLSHSWLSHGRRGRQRHLADSALFLKCAASSAGTTTHLLCVDCSLAVSHHVDLQDKAGTVVLSNWAAASTSLPRGKFLSSAFLGRLGDIVTNCTKTGRRPASVVLHYLGL